MIIYINALLVQFKIRYILKILCKVCKNLVLIKEQKIKVIYHILLLIQIQFNNNNVIL